MLETGRLIVGSGKCYGIILDIKRRPYDNPKIFGQLVLKRQTYIEVDPVSQGSLIVLLSVFNFSNLKIDIVIPAFYMINFRSCRKKIPEHKSAVKIRDIGMRPLLFWV